MGIDSPPTRTGPTENKTKGPDFYDPAKAPKREEIVGIIPEVTKQQWAKEQKEDGLQADVDLFVELNREELGISKFGMQRAKARILEEYRFLKEAQVIQDIGENDWKAFLSGEQHKTTAAKHETTEMARDATETTRDTTEANREDSETTRKASKQETVNRNIDKEKSIDNYLDFIREKQKEGMSSKAIISQLLNPNIEKGFEMPAEYIPELIKFQQLLDMDLGSDTAQIDTFISVAIADQQSFRSVAENIYASHTVAENTKISISEKFKVPYVATATDFRKASLGLQKSFDDLKATGEELRQSRTKLEKSLDLVESELSALEEKEASVSSLTKEESARLEELKKTREDLKKRLQENQGNQVVNRKNLNGIETDEDGHPVFQYCDFDVSIDQDNNQAIFKTDFGDCPVPLDWYNYSLLAGNKINNQINSFLLSTQFAEAGLSDHLFSEESRNDFMSGFMRSTGIGEPGRLVTSHDLDQARDMLKIFFPTPTTTGLSPETVNQNLKDIGLLDNAGELDPGKWNKALYFIDTNKYTSRYTSQDLTDFLAST